MVMLLALATIKRPSDLSLLRSMPIAIQVTADSITFMPVSGAKIAQPSHLYGPTITLGWSEDECLCPLALVKEYSANIKGREQRDEKLFITRKIGLTTPISNATVSHWLKETLNQVINKASGDSFRKAIIPYAAIQGVSIKTTEQPLCCMSNWRSLPQGRQLTNLVRCYPFPPLGRVTNLFREIPCWPF